MSTAPQPGALILLVDDEQEALRSYDLNLRYSGYTNTLRCPDSRQVRTLLQEREVSLILLDLCMPHVSGEDLLDYIKDTHPHIPTIVVTGSNEVDTAVRCMRVGSADYLVKPVDRTRLISAVKRALDTGREIARLGGGDGRGEQSDIMASIVTRDEKMIAICGYIKAIAPSPEPVLIVGETGVGKEMVARAIHAASGRQGEFVAVNAAGVDDMMFADTLFGHAKGAFTGASQPRRGLIEEAAGGSLFLDEIGDLSHASQLKLLRLIQEKEYYALGSDTRKTTDARIIAATNKSQQALLGGDVFRSDLFYRLRTHFIQLPPLRDRKGDLPILIEHFLGLAARKLGKPRPAPPQELLTLLSRHDFPGNVRELESMILDAVAQGGSTGLTMADFKAWIDSVRGPAEDRRRSPVPAGGAAAQDLPTLKEAGEWAIEEALRRSGGNQSAAACLLGISRQALNKRLLKHRRDKAHGDQG